MQESLQPPRIGSPILKKLSVKLKLYSPIKRTQSPPIEMIPKPPLTRRLINFESHVLQVPNGTISHILVGLVPRTILLKSNVIGVYRNQELAPEVTLRLEHMTSVQSVKYSKKIDGSLDLYCFEVNLLAPGRSSLQTYTFGVIQHSKRNTWMGTIMKSLTNVFPDRYLAEIIRAGWCYMGSSEPLEWSGAWLVLTSRELYFYNCDDCQVESIDLEKVCGLRMQESKRLSRFLHVQEGPLLAVQCKPYGTLHFVMATPKETKTWKQIIEQVARRVDVSLSSQLLVSCD